MRRAAWFVGVFCAVLATAAHAKLCGDDVDGRDVPCACGDVVVSDLSLGDDPVTVVECPADGLVIRARPGASRALRIDLRGRTLRGRGRGRGLWIVSGGPGGAHVESTGAPARLEGFGEGVVAVGPEALATLRALHVDRPRRTGVRVQGRGWTLADVSVADAGGDGFALGGSGFHVEDARAVRSRANGFVVAGRGGVLARIVAEESGAAGITLAGVAHRLAGCTVVPDGPRAVRMAARDALVRDCAAAAPRAARRGRAR